MFLALCSAAVAGLLAGGRPAAQVLTNPPPSAAPVWHLDGEARGTPLYDGQTTYFLTKQREVLAVDARSGAARWRSATGVLSHDALFGHSTAGSSLTLDGDTLIAGDWDVIAFDRRNGHRLWTYSAPAGDGPGLFLGPAANGMVYAGSPGGRVYALEAASGRLRWSTAIGGPDTTAYRPVIHGGGLAVGYTAFTSPASGGVAVLDAESGRERWRTPFPAAARHVPTGFTGGPILTDDLVVASSGDGNIYALDARTGEWRRTFPRLSGQLEGMITTTDIDHRALVRAGPLVVAGSVTGTVVAYHLASGEERWRFPAGYLGSTSFALAADDSSVYLPFLGGFMIAVDAATGIERWRYGHFTQGFLWPPAPGGSLIYAGAARTGFYGLAPIPKEGTP
jgi:eukaryotic-like serine/threonine-protein kinase